MHAAELRMSVTRIIDTLIRTNVKALVDQFRVAKDDQRTAAAARLGNAGATIVGRFDTLSADERRVVAVLHLDKLGTTEYWHSLLNPEADPKVVRGELVRLQSRILFATSHLPGMLGLLEGASQAVASDDHPYARYPLGTDEARLVVRLTDSSVFAADPDRVARAIDGIDMLYSACASIVQKHSIDLRLDAVDGDNPVRDLHFTGDQDCIASVITILDSIPGALASIEPGQDIDVESVVQSLPVFIELDAIASQGAFSVTDMSDIRDSVQQGALLSLESAAILIDPPGHVPASAEQAADLNGDDEHYERYLREREAMQHGNAQDRSEELEASGPDELTEAHAVEEVPAVQPNGDLSAEKPAIKNILKSLLKERNQ